MTDSGDLRKARKLLEDVFEYFASSVYAGPTHLFLRIADFLGHETVGKEAMRSYDEHQDYEEDMK